MAVAIEPPEDLLFLNVIRPPPVKT